MCDNFTFCNCADIRENNTCSCDIDRKYKNLEIYILGFGGIFIHFGGISDLVCCLLLLLNLIEGDCIS